MPEDASSQEVTQLLAACSAGDERAADRLLPLVYTELRRLARARMAKERPGQTLDPTGLVHEAFLRLVRDADQRWDSRWHFFGAAAEAMRRILIERAREKSALKRGGGEAPVSLLEEPGSGEPRADELLAIDEALGRLEQFDSRMAQVVKLRVFVGLSLAETAETMEGASERTVSRLWTGARAWLLREMRGQAGSPVGLTD